MTMHRRALGQDGEAVAAAWYERHGYRIVERNWRCRDGELDLVATRRGHLVVCEVKTRSSARYGGGAEAVDWRKQRTIRRVTAVYLSGRVGAAPVGIRFDVAVVTPARPGYSIEVIEHAF
ncbi:MAG: YraN family protein [Acidimicrobiales bacterium]